MALEDVVKELNASIQQLISVLSKKKIESVTVLASGSETLVVEGQTQVPKQEKKPAAEIASSPSGATPPSTEETGAPAKETTSEPLKYKFLADKFIALMNSKGNTPSERQSFGSGFLAKFGVKNLAHLDASRYPEVLQAIEASAKE